jgi:L-iditol 2-dehydrogenase
MKAVVLHGPGDLRVEQVPDPVLPAGGVVVGTVTVGICGSDVRVWRHGSPRLAGPQVLGHEVGGVVRASDVPALPVGTPVAVCPGAPCLECAACQAGRHNLCRRRRVLGYDIPGGMAEAFAVPSDWTRSGGVVPLPASVAPGFGAIAEPVHTVLNGQDEARIGPRDSVLVLGLGPIGVLHVMVARSRGASPVLGADVSAERVGGAAALLGPSSVVAISEDWASGAIGRTAEGLGFDVVVLATGAKAAVATAMDLVAPAGRILAFAGMPPESGAVDIDLNAIHYRQVSLVGAFGGTPPHFRRAVRWLAESSLDLRGFTPLRFPLDAAADAFASVARGDGLKTLLEIA